MDSIGAHVLRDRSHPHLVWANFNPGAVLRIVTETEMTFGASATVGAATPVSGSTPAGGTVTPRRSIWHESLRYFRMSQATTDLFDAFRNLYLGLESLLSEVESPVDANGKPRPDGQWLRSALGALSALDRPLSLAAYRPPEAGSDVTDIEAVFSDLYRTVRTSIFHAKTGRPYLLPQNEFDRVRVHEALQRYAGLYADLAGTLLGIRHGRSRLSSVAFTHMADTVLSGALCGVTADTYDDQDAFDADGGSSFIPFKTTRVPALDEPYRAVVRGELVIHGSPLAASGSLVRSAGARTVDGNGMTVESLGGALSLDGIETVQHQLTLQVFNAGFRQRYDS